MPNFTDEQLNAIAAKGKTIVSASAGSGKTTIMIKKIVDLIVDGASVDSVLCVTYTKAAAAQMKEKLREALIEKINEKGLSAQQKAYLKEQLNGVATANFSTIHAFCARLLRQYFFEGEVSNDFSIIAEDDEVGSELMSKAFDEIFDDAFKSGDEDFARLVAIYFKKRKDTEFRRLLKSLYGKMRPLGDYVDYFQGSGEDSQEAFDKICDALLKEIKSRADTYLTLLEKLEGDFLREKDPRGVPEFLLAMEEYLRDLLGAKDYYDCVAKVPQNSFNQRRKAKTDTPEITKLIELTVAVKKKVEDLRTKLLSVGAYDEEYERFADSMKTARALGKYLLLLDEKYEELKREKNLLDYQDLEYYALRLLEKGEVREEIRSRYPFVFVDEYQDVNPVQEKILSLIAGDNLFLVGDVKQSIYGFRGGKSQFFIDKEVEYKESGHNALPLPHNFRCATAVVEAVNAQFSAIMNKRNSSVDYENEGKMVSGGLYPSDHRGYGRVRVHFWGEDDPGLPKVAAQRGVYSVLTGNKMMVDERVHSRKILKIIEQEIGREYYDISEKSKDTEKKYKKVSYGDIAVLYRKKSRESIKELCKVLEKHNIPVVGGDKKNICLFPEVRTLIDILSVIDNARQEIAVCSAMHSLQGLTEQDFVTVRKAYRSEPFYLASEKYAKEKEDDLAGRLKEFFDSLASLRVLSQVLTVGELLTKILSRFGLETRFLLQAGGEESVKNIRRFVEEASATPMSVREFLDKLKKLDNEILVPVSGGENAVKLMTMHASKGLEFPVVILADMEVGFRGTGKDDVLISTFGFAPYYYKMSTHRKMETLLRIYHTEVNRIEQIKDELNLYYVAMTRAKFSLHLVFEKRPLLSDPYHGGSLQEMTDFSLWEKYICDYGISSAGAGVGAQGQNDAQNAGGTQGQNDGSSLDTPLEQPLEEALTAGYAYGGLENFYVKSSATGLMQSIRAEEEMEGAEQTENHPYFEAERAEDTAEGGDCDGDAVMRGLAYHAFLEHFDFAKLGGGDLRAQVIADLKKFADEKAFKQEYFSYLEVDKLCEILSLPIFARLGGCRFYKERAFLVGIAVEEVCSLQGKDSGDIVDKGEEVLFQGAIDLLAVGEEKTYIVDYKYSVGGEKYLKEHYAPQLALYKKAVAKITGRKTEDIEAVIVNIAKGFEVLM